MSAQREQVLDYSWLHDDTEEDLVGADWHQHAIGGPPALRRSPNRRKEHENSPHLPEARARRVPPHA